MAAPIYDDSAWPLVRIRLPAELAASEFEASLDYIDSLFLRGQRFAVLLDVRDAPPLSAPQRKLVADRSNAMYARYPTRLAGMALMLSSALQRGIFTAIRWLIPRGYPTRAFAGTVEAERWLRAQLAVPESVSK
jgi:hypothetical protein